jgi:hypothetical protein
MRLVKLSQQKEFPDYEDVENYFASDVWDRNPPGKFLLPRNQLAEDGVAESEMLLFSYLGRVVRVAKAASGRCENRDKYRVAYPYYFVIDRSTLREVDFSLADLEDAMCRRCGVTKTIAKGRGWVRLPETKEAYKAVEDLIRQKKGRI